MRKEPLKRLTVISVLLVVVFLGFGTLLPFVASTIIRALAFVLLSVLLLFTVRSYHDKRLQVKPANFPRYPLPPANVGELKRRAGRSHLMNASQAKLFALALTRSSEIRQRVTEVYEPRQRTLAQTVTIEGQIPEHLMEAGGLPEQLRRVYVPVIVPEKGKLLDEFSATDGGGCSVPVLSYRESLQLVATCLRSLLLVVADSHGRSGLGTAESEAETAALGLVMARNTNNGLNAGADADAVARIRRLPAGTRPARTARSIAEAMIGALTGNYLIAAVLEPTPTGRFLLTYRQVLIPSLDLARARDGIYASVVRRARLALGARPVDLTISVDNAGTCQSYHLLLSGTEGLYLARQQALDMTESLNTRSKSGASLPYARFRERLGQPHAHFYVRYFPETPATGESPRVRFRFAETPPGSLMRAVVAAVSSALLIWIIGAVNSRTPDPGTDAPAFLLAFPALAAAWLGFDSPKHRLFEGTLRARASLLITAGQSVVASALFMAHKAVWPTRESWPHLPFQMQSLGVSDWSWFALFAIAVSNAVYVSYKYWVLSREYAYFSTTPVHHGVGQNS